MIIKTVDFLKKELQGWKLKEIIWFAFCTAVTFGVSVYCKDSLVSVLGALTGVWCTILTGKGKRSAFIFGVFNVIFYSYVSYKAQYYGEVMLNTLYFLPMNFVGWFVWSRHMNDDTCEVQKSRMSLNGRIAMYTVTGVCIYLYGLILKSIGGNLPYIDSMSTVISVVAQVLSVRRMVEQWILWIIVDAVTVIMWTVNLVSGDGNVAMLVMWSVYLANGIIMFLKWNKEPAK